MKDENLANPRQSSRCLAKRCPTFGASSGRVLKKRRHFEGVKMKKRLIYQALSLVGLTGFEPVLPP
jgi:hypothetical protein